ncbi:MAG: nucleotidyltransferase family protein, partial [Actinomycetota bacterium]|nr:nucleotidyltransferase family protein [Actinomycetota bacterium]
SAEYRLLLHCATLQPAPSQQVLADLLDEALQWPRLVGLAAWHRLSPLVFEQLRRPELVSEVPPDAMEELSAAYYTTAARNAHALQELADVLLALAAEGIAFMPLKGAALLGSVYANPALRPMSDLDILVEEGAIGRAERLLEGMGYRPIHGERMQEAMRRSFRHYPPLRNRQGTLSVELHRDIVDPPLHYRLEGFWERARPATVAGVSTRAPAPEDLLVHLCLHFFMDRHSFRPGALKELVDISETIRHYRGSFDWELLLQEVGSSGVSGPTSCALLSAAELLGTPLPSSILQASLVKWGTSELHSFIGHRVLGTGPWPLRNLVPAEERYTPLAVGRNVLRRLFPTRAFLARKYADRYRWTAAWYGLHLRDTARRWGKRWAQLSLRPQELRRDWRVDRWLHSLHDLQETRRDVTERRRPPFW